MENQQPTTNTTPAPESLQQPLESWHRDALIELALQQPNPEPLEQLRTLSDTELIRAAGFRPIVSGTDGKKEVVLYRNTNTLELLVTTPVQQLLNAERIAQLLELREPLTAQSRADLEHMAMKRHRWPLGMVLLLTDRQVARAAGFEPMWPVTLTAEALAALEQLQGELLGGLEGEGITQILAAHGRPAE